MNSKNNTGLYRSSKIFKFLKIPESSAMISLVILFLIFSLVDNFFITFPNLRIILVSTSYSGMVAIGMALVLITGQFDLSAGGVVGFSATTCAIFMTKLNLPVWLSVLLALMIAVSIGLINGFLAVKVKIPPIISTLAMMFILIGSNVVINGGYSIYPLPESFNNFGRAKPLGLSWSIIIFIVLVFVVDYVLRNTTFGRKVYATGADVRVAKIMGINTEAIKIFSYVMLSFLAGLSGILFMTRIRSGSPEIGEGWILLIVAATVIGGISIYGGYGNVIGILFGSLIIWVMRSGLSMIGSRPEWQTMAIGMILILATIFDFVKRKYKLIS